jgi:hypothetical protein
MHRALGLQARRFLVAVVVFWSAALSPSQSRAEERSVTAPEALIRTAPFNVAPEVTRVRAGDRLAADDQPQGEWRRVRLPDGRYGFIRDADTKAEPVVRPPVPAATAGASAPETEATDSPEAAGSSAPAPENASPPKPVAGASILPPARILPAPVAAPPPQPFEPQNGPHLLGVMFELLPVGTLSAAVTQPNGTQSTLSNDSVFAVAVAPFIDGAASPYLTIGASPQIIFRVKGDGAPTESAKQLDLRFRLTGRVPMSPRVRVFGRLSPAYSMILLPSAAGDTSNPSGFLVDVTVGSEVAVLPNLFVIGNLGYQMGFQKAAGDDWNTSYLHIGGGLAIGL